MVWNSMRFSVGVFLLISGSTRAIFVPEWGTACVFLPGVFLLILGVARALVVPEWGTACVSLWVCFF